MVASGTVKVIGWKAAGGTGQPTDSASAHIAVSARDWSSKLVPYTFLDNSPGQSAPTNLPAVPSVVANLGQTVEDAQTDASAVQLIQAGPNAEFAYVSDLPVKVAITGAVNTTALSNGSTFWQMQPPERGTDANGVPTCGRNDVTAVVPMVRAHEGTSRSDQYSHVQTYMTALDTLARARFEGAVGPMSSLPVTTAVMNELSGIAAAHSRAITDSSSNNPFKPGCNFNYDSTRTYP